MYMARCHWSRPGLKHVWCRIYPHPFQYYYFFVHSFPTKTYFFFVFFFSSAEQQQHNKKCLHTFNYALKIQRPKKRGIVSLSFFFYFFHSSQWIRDRQTARLPCFFVQTPHHQPKINYTSLAQQKIDIFLYKQKIRGRRGRDRGKKKTFKPSARQRHRRQTSVPLKSTKHQYQTEKYRLKLLKFQTIQIVF